MDSIRPQSGMLAMITSQTDEITRDIQVDEKLKSIWKKNVNLIFQKKIKGCCNKSMYSIDTWFSLLFSNKACGRSIESNGWFNFNIGKC